MRFLLTLASTGIFAATALAAGQMKSVIVSYPDSTSDSIIEAAKKAIVDQGGDITHEYKLFKGFSATAPVKAFDVSTLSEGGATIEEDRVYTTQD